MKEIIIDINEDGDCSIEGKGFVGPECATFIGEIQECIGDTLTKTTKPEFRQREQSRGRDREINRG
ncbi:hypothetical protein LCGC14_2404100 [marine sediment metagenome]|uniref:DUF2997 domain-containing protein n=1 Tax=marine sediment metagenome TaxID=412755 RepID=A0A0F9BUF2_9ZZZZ